jgi:hypothetical protein
MQKFKCMYLFLIKSKNKINKENKILEKNNRIKVIKIT